MKANHTPGPWQILADGNIGHRGLMNVLTRVADVRVNDSRDANARLIAAAPELLAALAECVRTLDIAWDRCAGDLLGEHHNAGTDALEKARALVSQLKG